MVPPEAAALLEKSEEAIAKGKFKKADKLLKKSEVILTQEGKKGVKDLSGMNKRGAVGTIRSYIPAPKYDYGGRKKTRRHRRRGGGVVGDAIGAWKSLGSEGQASAISNFKQDLADAEEEKAGNEWRAREAEKEKRQSLEQIKQMSKDMQETVAAAAPGLIAMKQLKELTQGQTQEGGRSSAAGGDIVTHLLTIRNQIKLYHWQTRQFARHKATDDLTAALDLNIDAFVESYMGRYGRPTVSGSIKLHNFSESAAKTFVARETKYLQTELPRKIGKNDTDLLNMRDTILGDLTKVSYLFTLA